MRRRRDTADHLLLAWRFGASGCLDRLCWRCRGFRIFLTCHDSLVLAHVVGVSWLFWLLAPLFGSLVGAGKAQELVIRWPGHCEDGIFLRGLCSLHSLAVFW